MKENANDWTCRHPVKVVWIERTDTSTNKKLSGLLIQIKDSLYLYDKQKTELTDLVPENENTVKLEMI